MSSTTLEKPGHWAQLKDIHEVDPVGPDDHACLADIREALRKHGKGDRFGVALLHKHFEVSADEMLVEETDVESRVLTIKPVKRAEAGNTIQTIWRLQDGDNEAMMGCMQYCGRDVQGNHNSFHRMTRTTAPSRA